MAPGFPPHPASGREDPVGHPHCDKVSFLSVLPGEQIDTPVAVVIGRGRASTFPVDVDARVRRGRPRIPRDHCRGGANLDRHRSGPWSARARTCSELGTGPRCHRRQSRRRRPQTAHQHCADDALGIGQRLRDHPAVQHGAAGEGARRRRRRSPSGVRGSTVITWAPAASRSPATR